MKVVTGRLILIRKTTKNPRNTHHGHSLDSERKSREKVYKQETVILTLIIIKFRSSEILFHREKRNIRQTLFPLLVLLNDCFNFNMLFLKGALSGLRWFLATETPLKMMKNPFCFTLKALFVLKIFKFLFWLFGMYKHGLIRKARLISKFMTSQPG